MVRQFSNNLGEEPTQLASTSLISRKQTHKQNMREELTSAITPWQSQWGEYST